MRRIIFLLPILALLAACSDDEPQQPTPVNRVDIVTLESNSPVARLILDAPGVSGQKVLVADVPLREELEIGMRLLVDYDAAVADTVRAEVPVHINGYSEVLTAAVEPLPHEDILSLGAGEAEIVSKWRTGQWINVQMKVAYAGTPRGIGIAADESTLGEDEVKCYIYNPDEPIGPNSIGRTVYASFYIGGLDLLPTQKVSFLVKD